MSGPSAYAAVFRMAGARAFSSAGLVARMPASMVRLAIVLLVTAHGSYAEAGLLSAAAFGLVGSPCWHCCGRATR